MHEAGRTIFDLGLSNVEREDTYRVLQRALLNNSKVYGYRWASPSYTKERQEKHKKQIKINKNKYYQNKKNKEEISSVICPICRNKMDNNSKVCKSCYDKNKHDDSVKEKEEKYGITREILKSEIRTMSFLQIGEKYGVSDNAVRKWCKLYGLPFKATEIKQYTDEEWEQI